MTEIYLLTRADYETLYIVGAFSTPERWEEARSKFPSDDQGHDYVWRKMNVMTLDEMTKDTKCLFTFRFWEDGTCFYHRVEFTDVPEEDFLVDAMFGQPTIYVDCYATNHVEAMAKAKQLFADYMASGRYHVALAEAQKELDEMSRIYADGIKAIEDA